MYHEINFEQFIEPCNLKACKELWFNNKKFRADFLNRTAKEDKTMYMNLNTKER
jgi:hypothetical protein